MKNERQNDQKKALASEFEIELKKQFIELKPHFPNRADVLRVEKVWEKALESKDEIVRSYVEKNKIYRIFHSFVIRCEDRVFWTGTDDGESMDRGTFLDDEGNIVQVMKNLTGSPEAPEDESFVLDDPDSMLKYAPNFTFAAPENMENYISDLYTFKKYINIMASRLDVK